MGFTFPQTTTRETPDRGIAGQLAFPLQDETRDNMTAIMEAAVDQGVFVTLGAGGWGFADEIDLAGDVTTAGLLRGVVRYRPMVEPASPTFAIGDVVNVVRRGYIWVTNNGTTTDGGPCFIVFDNTNPANVRGSIRADAGGGTIAAAAPSGVRIARGGTTLSLVELNLI